MWNWHSLTDCTQNNLSRSAGQLSNDVAHRSCLKPIALPVWLAASSCRKRYSLTSCGLGWKVFTVEPPFNSQNDRVYAPVDNKKRYIDPSRLLRMSVMASVAMSQLKSGYDWSDICQPWGKGERPVLLRCLAVSADAFSNQTCCRTLFIQKTICCLRRNWSFFVFCE